MSETLIDFYAKPTVSILIESTYQQQILDKFTNFPSNCANVDICDRQVNKKLCKFMFSVYQKMMISFETLCLALEITQKHQFMNLLHEQFGTHNKTKKIFCRQSSTQSDSINQNETHQTRKGPQILQTYAIGLLYVCHKITDDFQHKYAANVWVENLRFSKITISDIKAVQGKIVCALEFDILRPTIYNLISVLMEEMKIKKSQFSYFTNYLLELYIQSNISKFIGESNRIKRIKLTLSSIKLTCHFLCPNSWNQQILAQMNFCSNDVQKYSCVLFGLFLDKSRNDMIHQKYKMKRYKQVANLKVKNSQKDKIRTAQEFQLHDQNKQNLKQLKQKSNKQVNYVRIQHKVIV